MAQFIKPNELGPTPRIGNGFAAPAFRGFQVSNDIQGSGNIAQIDARGFIAEAQSAGDIGDGLQSLGNDAAKIYVSQQRVIGRRKEMEVETMRSAASEDIAQKLADEKDETKWPELVAKEAEAHAKVWNEKSLSPETRDNIAAQDIAWKHRLISSAGANSRQRSLQLLGDTYNAQVYSLTEGKQYGAARNKVHQGIADGVYDKDGSAVMALAKIDEQEKGNGIKQLDAEADRLLGVASMGTPEESTAAIGQARSMIEASPDLDDVGKNQRLTQLDYTHKVNSDKRTLNDYAARDPAAGVRALSDPKQLSAIPATERAEALGKMRGAQEQAAGNAVINASRAIDLLKVNGGLDKATVETLGVDLSQALPWHKAVIARELEKAKNGTPEATESNYLSLYARASNYSPTDDKNGIIAARIETLAATLPPDYAQKITAKITERSKGGDGFDTGPALLALNEAVKKQKIFGSPEVAQTDPATGAALLQKNPTRYVRKGMKKDWFFDDESQPGETPDYYKEVPEASADSFAPDTIIDKFEEDRITAIQKRIADELEKKAKAGDFKTDAEAKDWMVKQIVKYKGKPMAAPASTGAPAPSAALMGGAGFDAMKKAQEILSRK